MSTDIEALMQGLREATSTMQPPAVTVLMATYGKNPFLALTSCILSLRTRDTVSLPASIRLFEAAATPAALLELPVGVLEALLYPVGFYRRKTITLHQISKRLLEDYAGRVPATFEELISLPGVGRKTANLVLGEGFGIPAICVDTHVHRISNRLGLVATKTPEETERTLKAVLPQKYWIEYNQPLVMWGQNVCVPLSPKCSVCPVAALCARKGVTRHR